MPYTLFEIEMTFFIVRCLEIDCYGDITVLVGRDYNYNTELVSDFVGFSLLEFHYAEDLFR